MRLFDAALKFYERKALRVEQGKGRKDRQEVLREA
jgi:hypothetical protein